MGLLIRRMCRLLIFAIVLFVPYHSPSLAQPSKIVPWSELTDKVEAELVRGNFARLDALALEYRNPNVRVLGGNSRLYHFYGVLRDYKKTDASGSRDPIQFDEKHRLLEQWLAQRPKSVAARIALAGLWSSYAWDGRGTGFADKVTEQQWKLFATRLEKARSYLTEEDLQVDPHLYVVLMSIAKGWSAPREVHDELYALATKKFPSYFHYYAIRADYLQEKWAGRKGELKVLAESVLQSPGGDDGLVAYSYIAYRLMGQNLRSTLYETTGLSWPTVQAAYAARQKRFGLRNQDWNAFCNLAIAGLDRQVGMMALKEIDGNWDPAVWKERKYFDSAVQWITTGRN
jgi:Domain of unknown function (DUF4034)